MASIYDAARNAAKKQPRFRTSAEQDLVDANQGDQQVRNNDHDAQRRERRGEGS